MQQRLQDHQGSPSAMHGSELPLGNYPKRDPGLRIAPFSSSSIEQTHIVCVPNGRCIEISGPLHEMLALMDGTRSIEEIAALVSTRLSREIRVSHVAHALERYFIPHRLVRNADNDATARNLPPPDRSRLKGLLVCPATRLFPITRRLEALFHVRLCVFILIAIALSCSYMLHQFIHNGGNSSLASFSSHDRLAGLMLIVASVLFHELGHLAACGRYGCTHGELRVGLYLFFPVFYSNVTQAWVLPRKARLIVDIGGIYFQLVLTFPAALAYWITGHPLWMYFCMAQISMAVVSLNPFLRFDGYWVCSDLLGVPNLRRRSRLYVRHLAASLLGKRVRSARSLSIRRPEKCALLLYAMLSHLFFVAGAALLAWYAPRRTAQLISSFPALLRRFIDAFHAGNLPDICSDALQVLVPAVLVVALCRMLWYGVVAIARVAKRKKSVRSYPTAAGSQVS